MPRNPDKTRCCHPNCNNWAMRGHVFCRAHVLWRAHRDLELGPRRAGVKHPGPRRAGVEHPGLRAGVEYPGPRAGAPPNNLNALKTGLNAHPLDAPELNDLARSIVHRPGEFPLAVNLAVESIHRRTRDPLKRALGVIRLMQQLVPLVSAELVKIELETILQRIPPARRENSLKIIKKHITRLDPVKQLEYIRTIDKHLFPENAKKQSTEPELGLDLESILACPQPGAETGSP